MAAGTVPSPDFVVWPENSTAVDPFLDDEVNAGIVPASDAIDVPILLGVMADDPLDDTQVLNQGIVYHPGVGGGDRYTKRHPVPYGEYIPFRGSLMPSDYGKLMMVPRDMVRGTSLEPIRVDDVLVADAICFDVAYDEGIGGQVARGAELVAVQTSNAMFSETAQLDQQFEISRLRALETGRWVVVAAVNGISGVVRPDGRSWPRPGPESRPCSSRPSGSSTTITPAVRHRGLARAVAPGVPGCSRGARRSSPIVVADGATAPSHRVDGTRRGALRERRRPRPVRHGRSRPTTSRRTSSGSWDGSARRSRASTYDRRRQQPRRHR